MSRNNFPPAKLQKYRENGNINTVSITLVQSQQAPKRIEETSEYKRFAWLKHKGIGIAEAGRKYDVAFQTIARWAKRGFIPEVGKEGPQKILLDESYVAYCAYVYKQNSGQGKTPFNKDGTPFIPKTIRT